jgi:hypothetical protein
MWQILERRVGETDGVSGRESQSGRGFAEKAARLGPAPT